MIPFFLIMVGVTVADLVSKILVRTRMPAGTEIPLLPFFSLTHVSNTGIAFGMFQEKNPFFIAVGIAVTASLVGYALRTLSTDRPSAFAMAAIIGGAVGNLLDRIWFGRVTDFLDCFVGIHHWPVFNVADSAICVGAVIVIVRGIWFSRPQA